MLGSNKSYDITTSKSREEIFSDIRAKASDFKQKDYFIKLDLVDYSSFNLEGNAITINRYPFVWDLHRGIGTISFEFLEGSGETIIKCALEVIPQYVMITVLCLVIIFTAFIGVLSFYFDNPMIVYLLLSFLPILGTIYLVSRYHRRSLEDYSKVILKDLNII